MGRGDVQLADEWTHWGLARQPVLWQRRARLSDEQPQLQDYTASHTFFLYIYVVYASAYAFSRVCIS